MPASKPAQQSFSGIFLVMGAGVLWGTLGPAGKQLGLLGVDMETVVFLRAFLGALVTGLFLAFTDPKSLRFTLKELPLLLFYGGFSVALMYGGFFLALNTISVALTEVTFYTFPLMVALLSFAMTGERPSRAQYIGAALTLGGVAAAVLPSLNAEASALTGILWSLGSALACATYMLLGRKVTQKNTISPKTLFFYGMAFGALALGIFKSTTLGWQDMLRGFSPPQWGWLLYASLIGSLGGYSLFYLGIPRVSTAAAAVISAVEVLTAITLACIFNKTFPHPLEGFGASLIIISILVAAMEEWLSRTRRYS